MAGAVSVASAQGAEIRFGNIVPGAGVIERSVISMRDARYTDMVRQHTDYSCGAASLATILKYAYGRDVTEQEILRGMLAVSDPALVRRKGFSLLDIKHYVETLGMQGMGYQVPPQMLPQVKVPTIVLLNIKGYEHFVVLKKVAGDQVYVADPALGNRTIPLKAFVQGWNGIIFAVIGKGYDTHTVLLDTVPPLSARRLLTVMAPTAPVHFVDFGYANVVLF